MPVATALVAVAVVVATVATAAGHGCTGGWAGRQTGRTGRRKGGYLAGGLQRCCGDCHSKMIAVVGAMASGLAAETVAVTAATAMWVIVESKLGQASGASLLHASLQATTASND